MDDRQGWTWRPDRQTWWPRPGNGFKLTEWLKAADAQAPRAERNVWLIRLIDWVRRGEPLSGTAAVLGHIRSDDATQASLRAWLQAFWRDNDLAALLADHGLAERPTWRGEWTTRLHRKLLPLSPDSGDLAAWFELLLRAPDDEAWIEALDARTLEDLGELLGNSWAEPGGWREPLLDAMGFLASQVRSTGVSPAFRVRLGLRLDDVTSDGDVVPAGTGSSAFRALGRAVDELHTLDRQRRETTDDDERHRLTLSLRQHALYLRGLLDQCVQDAQGLHGHLDRHGISLDLVFQIDQLERRCERMHQLLDVLMADSPGPELRRLVLALMRAGHARRSLRAWVGQQHALLARKVTERSAEVGEHYITRDAEGWRDMLARAAGGGTVLAGTTFVKFAILKLGWTPFWLGLAAGLNYAVSFVLVQLLQFTVATKQPAMTAPALTARLAEVHQPGGTERFVDEVAHLMRSQVAGILGNMMAVAPMVAFVQGLTWWVHGAPLVGEHEAHHVTESLTLWGPTLGYAAFTGVLLFASSILAGWTENWFVLNRVDSALRWNPRIQAWLGESRAARWAASLRANVAGLAANISLGLMLGLVPVLAHFVALPLDVRHVTLSTGQWTAAVIALGPEAWSQPEVWWGLLALPLTGVLNVGVSFWLAWRVAVRARGLHGRDLAQVRAALWRRVRTQPGSFVRPPRTEVPPAAQG